MTRAAIVIATVAAAVLALGATVAARSAPVSSFSVVQSNRLWEVAFPPETAKFVRFAILECGSEPCLDELEIYGPAGGANLALARDGAKPAASSCLPGYAIHLVEHLNDGLYGNSHSWIAAGRRNEWAQIELTQPTEVSRVVFSRDREGRYSDREPEAYEIQVSLDGRAWKTVSRVGACTVLPATADAEQLLRYAFACEQRTWSRIDPDEPVTRVLKQFEAMIQRLQEKGLDVSGERAEFAALRTAQTEGSGNPARREEKYFEARMAKRRLFLRDPDLSPLARILFVKRHAYEPSHNYSDILDARWRPGGGVCVLDVPRREGRFDPDRAKVSVLFDASSGVARDAMADFDARRVHFAYRDGPDAYYHLFSVEADGGGLRQVTQGPFHDYYPCPLPDGGLAFVTTRCRARFLCWRPQAFVLFRMDADGGSIRPLSFANLSEWAPSVMRDGRILWTRSEYLDKGADFGHTLWAIRPDGALPELVFGNNTPNCYMNGREVPGTAEICATLISHGGDLNGPIGLIDPARGRSNPDAVVNITPDTKPRYNMDWAREECFRDPVPIARDYFLCSHAPRDHFGLYVLDRWGNRELIHMDPAIGSMCPTPLRAEPAPPRLPELQAVAGTGERGEFLLQDVYRGLEPAVKRGSVKLLRVCEEVRADLEPLGNGEYRRDHPAFQDWYATPIHKVNGPNGWPSYVAKASLGLVPVEPDGSARFYAPAGKVLYFEALDGNFNEIQRMRSVVQLQPGERRSCVGCHESRASTPPARPGTALQRAPSEPETPAWGAVPFSYEKVVQPVWDARCVRCHDAADARKLNLTGALDAERVPASYRTLIEQGWVHYFDMTYSLRHRKADPLSFGSVKSRLIQVLDAGHYDAKPSADEMLRVKTWIDLNCPLWPDYIERGTRPATAAIDR
jgi:hypothetical protein